MTNYIDAENLSKVTYFHNYSINWLSYRIQGLRDFIYKQCVFDKI